MAGENGGPSSLEDLVFSKSLVPSTLGTGIDPGLAEMEDAASSDAEPEDDAPRRGYRRVPEEDGEPAVGLKALLRAAKKGASPEQVLKAAGSPKKRSQGAPKLTPRTVQLVTAGRADAFAASLALRQIEAAAEALCYFAGSPQIQVLVGDLRGILEDARRELKDTLIPVATEQQDDPAEVEES